MHDQRYERLELEWCGFLIEIRFCSDWSPSFEKVYGYAMTHFEIETLEPVRAPLPLTQTGYLSHFVVEQAVKEAGGPLDYVLDTLNNAAAQRTWKEREQTTAQYAMF